MRERDGLDCSGTVLRLEDTQDQGREAEENTSVLIERPLIHIGFARVSRQLITPRKGFERI